MYEEYLNKLERELKEIDFQIKSLKKINPNIPKEIKGEINSFEEFFNKLELDKKDIEQYNLIKEKSLNYEVIFESLSLIINLGMKKKSSGYEIFKSLVDLKDKLYFLKNLNNFSSSEKEIIQSIKKLNVDIKKKNEL